MDYSKGRAEVVAWLRKQLMGPASENNILRGMSPLERYPTGVLFPIVRGEEGIDPASFSDDSDTFEILESSDQAPDEVEPTTKRRRYTPPSSAGFSFYVTGETVRFQVLCSAAQYLRRETHDASGRFTPNDYERTLLGGDAETFTFEIQKGNTHRQISDRKSVLGGAAGIEVLWRQFSEGWIVTISLFNQQELDLTNESSGFYSRERNELSLFEVELRCFLEAGRIVSYPRTDKSLLTNEEQELDLQYETRHIYSVGHGVAVDWLIDNGKVIELFTQFMPAAEVPMVTADIAEGDNKVLELSYLASNSNESEVFHELEQFVAGYGVWVLEQGHAAESLDDHSTLFSNCSINKYLKCGRKLKDLLST